ncbi:MAG: hypothetical protein DDT40_00621 [candidate division WS2 bacterium]|nr:hypothetical protein [Candidatus Psychracetigena formicireducens]
MKKTLLSLISTIGIPRIIIAGFLTFLLITAFVLGVDVNRLLSDSLVRIGRNGLFVLALLPTLKAGVGLNFGLSLGAICGLIGLVLGLELGITGINHILLALVIGVLLAVIIGYIYGVLLNQTKGQEMMVGNYIGFATVSLMCTFWLLAPFRNPTLVWAIGGRGLRTTLVLPGETSQIIDNFLSFSFFGLNIPTGTFVLFFLSCLLLYFFFKTRSGLSMVAVGSNPVFARASGIKENTIRIQSVVLSTVLAAFGMIIFAQSFGFVQLYMAPLMLPFPAIACILIGGASLRKATLLHVIIGTALFQTLLTITLPVVTQAVAISGEAGDITEVLRVIISNGLILYALTRKGGD